MIVDEEIELTMEDLIADEQVVITATRSGFIKRTALHIYKSQHRGGKGRVGMSTKTGGRRDQLSVHRLHPQLHPHFQ